MSFEAFSKKMKAKAAAAIAESSEAFQQLNCILPKEMHTLLGRIGRASETPMQKVVAEFLHAHINELKELADSAEKLAPKERLTLPLTRQYRRTPTIPVKQIKQFVADKKK